MFCPYTDICQHGLDILSTLKPKMERLESHVEIFHSIDEVTKDVTDSIFRAYQSSEKMWSIIKAQTSSGKTTSYLKLMEMNPSARFLIAAPTNILKNEIYHKAKNMGIGVTKTPSLEEIKDAIPSKVHKHISRLYKTGRHHSVHPYINEILKKKNIPRLREYMEEREKLKTFNGSVITTHRYFLNMDEKRLQEYSGIIIDEDIIFKSIISNQGEITITDLKKLLKSSTDIRLNRKLKKLLSFAKSNDSMIELNGFEWDDEEDDDGTSSGIDVPSLCISNYFYCRKVSKEKNLKEDSIVFLNPVKFKNARYIMVSATVDEKICRDYFGTENVDFYECKKARYKGKLVQYYDRPMSRSHIDAHPGVIKQIVNRFDIAEDKVITFLKYGVGNLHFGNTEGCNTLEGKDILVIGTPHHASFIYKLFAFSIGLDFDAEAEIKRGCIVTCNGWKFPFTTFNDEHLKAIHFWMLESELEQAVGRARLLRKACTVSLFSNFPLSQAMLTEYNQ